MQPHTYLVHFAAFWVVLAALEAELLLLPGLLLWPWGLLLALVLVALPRLAAAAAGIASPPPAQFWMGG